MLRERWVRIKVDRGGVEMAQTRKIKRTYAFKDGRLTISEKRKQVSHLTAWPVPVAEDYDWRTAGWRRVYPDYRFITPAPTLKQGRGGMQMELQMDIPGSTCSRKDAYGRLRQTIPAAYADLLEPLRSHQWGLLEFLALDERFAELMNSTLPLAYMIANNTQFQMKVFYKGMTIEEIIHTPQAKLLNQLKLPGSKGAIKLLRKLDPESISIENMRLFTELLKNKALLPWVRPLNQINTGVLHLLCRETGLLEHVTPAFVEEVSVSPQSRYSIFAFITLSQTVRLCVQKGAGRIRVPNFRSLQELQAMHTQLLTDCESLKEPLPTPIPFPPPPIRGIKTIIPLKTRKQLREEGHKQHNCVGGYDSFVISGQKYIYAVQAPQRATLAIEKTTDGKWVIGELRAACNKGVEIETFWAVEEWLEEHRETVQDESSERQKGEGRVGLGKRGVAGGDAE